MKRDMHHSGEQSSDHTRSSVRCRRLGALAVACLVLVAAAALKLWESPFGSRAPGLREIAQSTGIRFAPSARLVASRRDWWENLAAKATIDAADSHKLMPATSTALVESSRTNRFGITNAVAIADSEGWWKPDSVREFTAVRARGASDDRWALGVLIERRSKGTVTVYIYYGPEAPLPD